MAATVSLNFSADSASDVTQGWSLVGCLSESESLTRFNIGKFPFVIGRAPSNDLCIPSPAVSKVHAQIIAAGDAVLIRDLSSTNGTFVNGRKIDAPTPVGDGDLLQFADIEFSLAKADVGAVERTIYAENPQDGWLISRLHEVVSNKRITMHYQPIVAAGDLQWEALEALVRCDSPGLESPLVLFEEAARVGVERRLSDLCRKSAVHALGNRATHCRLFLNTHPREPLGPELIESLSGLSDQLGSRQLVLEIHEGAVPELAEMREFRAALRDLGIGLAYDDFGAGQSRLLELTRVPPDFLKFDRSLLKDLGDASLSHCALLQTLLKHAADMGIATVAEGLDQQATVDICRDLGFTHLQGYHLGRPAPAESLPE